MFKKSKREPAVSPVIGTILLVAITVVLVAIIGAVVMSLADSEDGKKVGMNAQPDNTNTARAKLILYGGESISELVKLEMIDQDSPNGFYVELWNSTENPIQIGVPYTTKGDVAKPLKSMAVYDTRINVKGTFTDGTEVILLVQPMSFGNVEGPPNPHGLSGYIEKVIYVDIGRTNGESIDLTNNHLVETEVPKYFGGSGDIYYGTKPGYDPDDPYNQSKWYDPHAWNWLYGYKISGTIHLQYAENPPSKITYITAWLRPKNYVINPGSVAWLGGNPRGFTTATKSVSFFSHIGGEYSATDGEWTLTITITNENGETFSQDWELT